MASLSTQPYQADIDGAQHDSMDYPSRNIFILFLR